MFFLPAAHQFFELAVLIALDLELFSVDGGGGAERLDLGGQIGGDVGHYQHYEHPDYEQDGDGSGSQRRAGGDEKSQGVDGSQVEQGEQQYET